MSQAPQGRLADAITFLILLRVLLCPALERRLLEQSVGRRRSDFAFSTSGDGFWIWISDVCWFAIHPSLSTTDWRAQPTAIGDHDILSSPSFSGSLCSRPLRQFKIQCPATEIPLPTPGPRQILRLLHEHDGYVSSLVVTCITSSFVSPGADVLCDQGSMRHMRFGLERIPWTLIARMWARSFRFDDGDIDGIGKVRTIWKRHCHSGSSQTTMAK
jgi:hypothetical protein